MFYYFPHENVLLISIPRRNTFIFPIQIRQLVKQCTVFFLFEGLRASNASDLFGKKNILSRTSFDGETIAHYENCELAI